VIEETQEHNLGSPENPMSAAQLRAKFDENANGVLSAAERDRLAVEIDDMESLDDVSTIVELSIHHTKEHRQGVPADNV
jgi:2-methylcitrate dehydratase PrpD